MWIHWIQFAVPATIIAFGGDVLVRSKVFIESTHPFMILFLLSIASSFIGSIWSGVSLAKRFDPRRNEWVAGPIIGIAGFLVSTVIGFVVLIMLTRDMVIAESGAGPS